MQKFLLTMALVASPAAIAQDVTKPSSIDAQIAPEEYSYQVTISEWLPNFEQSRDVIIQGDKGTEVAIFPQAKGSRVEFHFDGKLMAQTIKLSEESYRQPIRVKESLYAAK